MPYHNRRNLAFLIVKIRGIVWENEIQWNEEGGAGVMD